MIDAFAKKSTADLTFIFPHIHHEKKWDISSSTSLWAYFINNNIVEPLIRVDSRSNYRPAIAKSWFVSENKKELIFSLSEQYRFHSGNIVKGKDVYNSILRVLKLKSTAHSELSTEVCERGDCSKNIELNGNRLTIKLNNSVNGILFNLASPEYGIVPNSYIQSKSVDKEDLKNLSGPYSLLEFNPKNILLKAHKLHPLFSEKSPQIVNFKEITNIENSIQYYLKNKNVVLVGSEYSSSVRLNKLKGNKFLSSFALTEFIVPNRRSKSFHEQLPLRVFTEILQKVKSELELDEKLTEITDQLFTKDSLVRLDEVNISREKRQKLTKPISLKMILFDWMKDSPVPYKIREKLKNYNIELNIEVVGVQDYGKIISERDYDLLYIYSGVSALEPIVELIYLSKHPLIDLAYQNESILEKIKDAKIESNRTQYLKKIKNIHRSIIESFRIIPLFHTRMIYITNSSYKVDNMNFFDGGLDLWNWKK
ncbi:MAG: hypothetical protein KAG61_01935 [Bacteriovoracaceae bacterium]|nr:hypothetical protein [Bacteriovoracaceae bacterium]